MMGLGQVKGTGTGTGTYLGELLEKGNSLLAVGALVSYWGILVPMRK